MTEGNKTKRPGDVIKEELENRNWTQADFAMILGRPLPVVNKIITGRTSITLDTAQELSEALGKTPEYWLQLDVLYRLTQIGKPNESIRQRAYLYEIAPVNEMERRGWIGKIKSIESLEKELKKFFNVNSLRHPPIIPFTARASTINTAEISSAQNAWCFRAAKLASILQASKFTKNNFSKGCEKLKQLAAYPEDVRYVPRILAEMGIRFVVVEHLPRTKIDGAAIWINHKSPVIALSLRYDRIDCFWHTLAHELSHINHNDVYSLDEDLVGSRRTQENKCSEIEIRADKEAAELLIPKTNLDSFVLRIKPLYSKQRIIQFAHRMKIHPGIIAGQLQHRGEIQYNANREMLVKVRDILIQDALTDGWGKTVNLN